MPVSSIALRMAALIVVLAAAVSVTTAQAATGDRTGTRLSLFAGASQTLPAQQPFYLQHGWGLVPQKKLSDSPGDPQAVAVGAYLFTLAVDGVPVQADFIDRSTTSIDPYALVLERSWVFDFPTGMTGTHTFTGTWSGPCEWVVVEPAGACANPAEQTTALVMSTTVTFVPKNLALGKQATASSSLPTNPPSDAVDGDNFSYWNSGDYPSQSIEIDLGRAYDIGRVDLSITQLPNSYTVHDVYGRADTGDPWTLLHELAGFTTDLQILEFTANAHVRYLKIETTSSASWVAWREIAVYPAS